MEKQFKWGISTKTYTKSHQKISFIFKQVFIINPIPISKSNPINNINDELKECIAIICCYHQSKWKFYNEPGNNYFGTLTSESINQKILIFGKYRTDGDVDINILYLSALLRFLMNVIKLNRV